MRDILMKIFGPILYVFGFIIVNGYRLFIGWWLEPRLNRKADIRFAEEIRAKLPFFFDEHGAKLLATDEQLPHRMDAAYATFESGNVHLRFMTGRGDLTVLVAPRHAPSEWDELSLIAMVVDTPQGMSARPKVAWLEDVGRLLQTKWTDLNEAFSAERYPVIRRRLDAIYDLPPDDLWRAGISIPERLRTGTRAPLPVAKHH